jgi:hypothetical protein
MQPLKILSDQIRGEGAEGEVRRMRSQPGIENAEGWEREERN